MNHTIKMCLMGAVLSLVACGPGAKIGGGKQGAAEALYAASGPTKGSTDRNASGIDVTLTDLSVSCQFGGKAILKNYVLQTDPSGTGTSIGAKYTVAYEKCGAVKTEAGVAELNGGWEVVQAIQSTTASAKVAQTFKGKVTYNGAFDDFLEADISQSVDVTALGSTGGTVAVVLKGTLTDSSGTYTYDEAVNVTAGNLSVQVTKN